MTREQWAKIPDEELAEQLRGGAEGALDELFRRYQPAIQRFCGRYLGDEALGEDVSQDTFARIAGGVTPEGALRPWLYRVARNRCLDILRRRQISPTHGRPLKTGIDAIRASAGPGTRVAGAERDALLRELVHQLPDEYHSVLLLKFVGGLSRQEIAAALEVSEASVKGRLARGLEALQELVDRVTGSGG